MNTGIHDLWGVYRNMFLRRRDPQFRPILDVADLVAADCYKTALESLHGGPDMPNDAHATPPVVHLMACLCPLAVWPRPARPFYRGAGPYCDHRVPIPVVVMPEDHANCIGCSRSCTMKSGTYWTASLGHCSTASAACTIPCGKPSHKRS